MQNKTYLFWYLFLVKIFGTSFALKSLERREAGAEEFYKELKNNSAYFENLKNTAESEKKVLRYIGKLENGKVVTSGGRVLAVTSFGNNFQEAIKKSYQNIDKLHFDKMYFRKDIGFDL